MLKQLNIENVAVIEKADIEFEGGFNVLTGETGAGKSILIDSINAILGNRTSKEIVRSGTDKSVIWAMFDEVGETERAILEENGYSYDGTLIVYREITAEGKSICRINNRPATAALVREICSTLVNIHGQHDSQALLSPDRHIYILDAYAELEPLRAQYAKVFSRLVEVKHEIEQLSASEQQKQADLDLFLFQVDEIEKAQLSVEEEAQLNERKLLIRNSERIVSALKCAHEALDGQGETGAVSLVYEASSHLEAVAGVSKEMESYAARLTELYYNINELRSDLGASLESLDFDELEAEDIEQRLDLIYKLKQKYGQNVAEILEYCQATREKISTIEHSTQRLLELNEECRGLLDNAQKLAGELSEKRLKAFEDFAGRIRGELEFLNMPGITFVLQHSVGAMTKTGWDNLEFCISANPGEPAKPLAKIASGGELSRIMLAIKNALAEKDDIFTLIFDEIDTGISGTSAQRVAKKLKEASKTRQIICVTHSAPIAAYSDNHLLIQKSVHDGRTFTTVSRLNFEQRKQSIAQLISGENVTDISLQNALEMLELAGKQEN